MVLFGPWVEAGLNHMSRPRPQWGAMPISSSQSPDRVRQSRGLGPMRGSGSRRLGNP